MPKKTIDIILPCYNPISGWQNQIIVSYSELVKLLPEYKIAIILVNDGSSSGISENDITFLKESILDFTYIPSDTNLGKGAAIKKGFEVSTAYFSVFTDIDFPYHEQNIVAMLEKLVQNADIVIGIRDQNYYQKVPFVRSMLSKSFKKTIKVLFKIPTTDTQAGLKAFSKKGKEIILKTETNRYLFDLELIKRSAKANLNFAYVSLNLKENIVLSKLSMKILLGEVLNLLKIFML